jgi:hypothetical protein
MTCCSPKFSYKAQQKAEAKKFLDWHVDEFGDDQSH